MLPNSKMARYALVICCLLAGLGVSVAQRASGRNLLVPPTCPGGNTIDCTQLPPTNPGTPCYKVYPCAYGKIKVDFYQCYKTRDKLSWAAPSDDCSKKSGETAYGGLLFTKEYPVSDCKDDKITQYVTLHDGQIYNGGAASCQGGQPDCQICKVKLDIYVKCPTPCPYPDNRDEHDKKCATYEPDGCGCKVTYYPGKICRDPRYQCDPEIKCTADGKCPDYDVVYKCGAKYYTDFVCKA